MVKSKWLDQALAWLREQLPLTNFNNDCPFLCEPN